MSTLNFFCDGSSDNRVKIAGWSAIFMPESGKPSVWYGHLEHPSTNNHGELLGIMASFSMGLLFQNSIQKPIHKLLITSDSQYAIGSLDPASGWNGAKNLDLIGLGMETRSKIHANIELKWVKGHKGNEGNELADKFAGYGRKKFIVTNDPRYNVRYFESKVSIVDQIRLIINS